MGYENIVSSYRHILPLEQMNSGMLIVKKATDELKLRMVVEHAFALFEGITTKMCIS